MRDMAEDARSRAHEHLSKYGYGHGGELGQMKTIAKRAIREHENAEHGGKHEHLKLKNGGHVKGASSESRPDRARGGHAGGKGKIGAVNVVIGKGDEAGDQQKEQMAAKMGQQQGIKAGMQLGARMAAQKMAGGPPGGAGTAGPPMGAPPPRPPMAGPGGPMPGAPGPQMAKDGGKIRVRAHERRRGGACE